MSPRPSCMSLLRGEDSNTSLSPLLCNKYKLPSGLLCCVIERRSPTCSSILFALVSTSTAFAPATQGFT